MSDNVPDDSPHLPPDDWFIEAYAKDDVHVNFYDIAGNIEAISAFWMENNVFSLDETPLRVNGVSIEDLVEVEWRENEVTPYFLRVKAKSTFRTFRARLRGADATNRGLLEFLKTNTYNHRIDRDLLAFSIYQDDDDDDSEMQKLDLIRWKFDLSVEETDSAEREPR